MSTTLSYLHSHSGLERYLNFHKCRVLVDAKFKHLFLEDTVDAFTFNGVDYIEVPILSFVRKGGVFKNLNA